MLASSDVLAWLLLGYRGATVIFQRCRVVCREKKAMKQLHVTSPHRRIAWPARHTSSWVWKPTGIVACRATSAGASTLALWAMLAACSAEKSTDDRLQNPSVSTTTVAGIADEVLSEDAPPDFGIEATAGHVAEAPAELAAAPAGIPNIVVIIADDLPRGMFGFEGNALIDTPHLDALKKGGVYFDNFYLPIGQCAPSRAILWTGLFPTQSGVETNGQLFKNPNVPVLPLALHDNGYRTGFFGKCHIGTSDPRDLDVRWKFDSIFHSDGGAKAPVGFEVNLWDPLIYQIVNISGAAPGVHFTKLITDKAIEFIQRESAANRPFFVWLAHRAPHPVTLADTGPDGEWSNAPPDQIYNRDAMPPVLTAAKANDTLEGKPPQQASSPSRWFYGEVMTRPGGIKEQIRRAFEQVRYLDTQVGRLTDELQRLGLRENTLVVVLSDNGAFFGERGLAGKGPFNYDEITRVPLVMNWPARFPAGVTKHALIQSTDLSATLLEAATLAKLPGSMSSSFLPLADGSKADDSHRASIFFQYHSQKDVVSQVRGVLKNGFKLSHYLYSHYFAYAPEGGAPMDELVPLVDHSAATFELYDLKNDPNELHNLLPYVDMQPSALWLSSRDAVERKRLNDLLRTMAEHQTNTGDGTGLRLDRLAVKRLDSTRAAISWRSVKTSSGADVQASAEVVFRAKDCGSCQAYEVDLKHSQVDHNVTLTALSANTAYEALIYSISDTSNGGFARYIIPAAPGQSGYAGQGNPRLSYVWNSYETVVKEQSGPVAQAVARCLIISQKGYVFADYQGLNKVCVDDCRTRWSKNPSRTCSWDGKVFQQP